MNDDPSFVPENDPTPDDAGTAVKPWPPLERRPDVRELAFAALYDLPDTYVVDWLRCEPVRVRHIRASLEAGHVSPARVIRVLLERDLLRPGFGCDR